MTLRLRNARIAGELHHLHLAGGRIVEPRPCRTEIDLDGRLVVPGFVDAHCHLDKTLWSGPWVPNTAGSDLDEKIAYTREGRSRWGVPSAPRITELLRTMVAAGTTRVRTHTDVSPEFGLDGFEAVAEASASLSGLVDVEQVAFPQYGLLTNPGTVALVDLALSEGLAQVVGGIDPVGVDGDADRHLETVFELALRHGVPVDIHLHDHDEVGCRELDMIIDRTLRTGLQGRVTVSHCYALAEADGPEQIEQIARLASADIALTTCAAHNDPLAPVLALASAGVRLGLGSDGIRDLWSPWGNGDLLDRAHQLAYRNAFDADPDVAHALDLATTGGAAVLGVDDHGTEVGDVADLVVLDSRSEAEAVVTRASRHLVFKRGVLVARDGVLTSEITATPVIDALVDD